MVEEALPPFPEENGQDPAVELPEEVRLPMVVRFVIDILVGTCAFAIMADAAAALSVFVVKRH